MQHPVIRSIIYRVKTLKPQELASDERSSANVAAIKPVHVNINMDIGQTKRNQRILENIAFEFVSYPLASMKFRC